MNILFKILKHYFYDRPYYSLSTKSTLTDDKRINKIIKELNSKGICIIKNHLSKNIIEQIKLEINDSLNNVDTIKNSKIYDFKTQGIKRYLNAENLSSTANKYFFNSFFDKVAMHYVSKNVKAYQKMYEIKGSKGKFATTDIFHFDDWKKRFKVFLYLNDVNENNCPFCYIPESTKIDKKKLIKQFEYIALGKSGAYGYYLPHEMENVLKKRNNKELLVTGEAGTIILVDTRGLHRGSPSLNDNQRELLGIYYDLRSGPGSRG